MAATNEPSQRAPKSRGTPIPGWMPKFLEALARRPVVTWACEEAGVSAATVYRHRKNDPDFARQWEEAEIVGNEQIVREMFRRGVEGYRVPVIYKGKLQGVWVNENGEIVSKDAPGARLEPLTVKEFSDQVLIKLAEGKFPAVFGKRMIMTGPSGGPVEVEHSEAKDRILGRVDELKARRDRNGEAPSEQAQ